MHTVLHFSLEPAPNSLLGDSNNSSAVWFQEVINYKQLLCCLVVMLF